MSLFAHQGQGYVRHLLKLNPGYWLLQGGGAQERCGNWSAYAIALTRSGRLVAKRLQPNYAHWLGHCLAWHVVPVWHEPKLVFVLDYIDFV